MARRRGTTDSPIVFEAALVPAGRKALTLDADGEATLTLVVPATDALQLAQRFPDLMDRAFTVEISVS